jgi:hypothetical protein
MYLNKKDTTFKRKAGILKPAFLFTQNRLPVFKVRNMIQLMNENR